MPSITIQGTVIDIPDSGESPNWAPAIIQFCEAVQDAIATFAAPYDVAQQIQNIGSSLLVSNVNIDGLTFPISEVVSSIIYYSVMRTTTTEALVETGELAVNYNGSTWELQRLSTSSGPSGDAKITFNITSLGQVQFSTQTMTGSSHVGVISYRAISNTKN